MTSRRDILIIIGAAALVAGCRETARGAAAVPDLVLADTRRGLLALDGRRLQTFGADAIVGPDAGLVYAITEDEIGGTALVSVDPSTATRASRTPLAGRWFPRVVSTDGRRCALTASAPVGAEPPPRAGTALLVAEPGATPRRYDLAGIIEPDAFTGDGTGLFVLEWLPAHAPDRYRVRLLDLATGLVQPLLTRAKSPVPAGAEEEMRGEGRRAVLSPDRRVLYTLYTHQPGHQHTRDLVAGRSSGAHAFVHVLSLAESWAYCLDLPHPFGEGPPDGHAIAVSPDGRRLAVADMTSGSLVYANTETLVIERVAAIGPPESSAASMASDGRRIFLGAGRHVRVVDEAGAVTARWSLANDVRGLGLSRDGGRLYAGGADEVVWLDTATGATRGRVPVAGLTSLRQVR